MDKWQGNERLYSFLFGFGLIVEEYLITSPKYALVSARNVSTRTSSVMVVLLGWSPITWLFACFLNLAVPRFYQILYLAYRFLYLVF